MQNEFEILPTGKKHVSFSEVKLWKECSYRHFLTHVKKIDFSKPSPILSFGTAVHLACENYLLTKSMDIDICHKSLEDAWKQNESIEDFNQKSLTTAKDDSSKILLEIPNFLNREFPDWEIIDAEHEIYESVQNQTHAFKGFIDGVIKCKGKRGEDLYWIIDWKTSQNGWRKDKRSDEMIKSQLALYKNFWSKKNPQIPLKNIRCAFVILKKNAKLGQHCELFSVSLGEVPINRSLKVVNNMITSVKRGISIKNRDSCKYCEYYQTNYCV